MARMADDFASDHARHRGDGAQPSTWPTSRGRTKAISSGPIACASRTAGADTVQLLRRTWQITDARGRMQHVHGAGVVGQQPVLEPGEAFEYTSGTPLGPPSGFMAGAYHMVQVGSGEAFDVAIPAFSLDSPHQPGRFTETACRGTASPLHPPAPAPCFCAERSRTDRWIPSPTPGAGQRRCLPRRRPTREEAEAAVRTLLRWAGDDPDREGLRDTPARVVRSYEEFFAGYHDDPVALLERTFEETDGYDEIVLLRDIRLESHCEHHMVPIIGRAHVAYLPQPPGGRHQQAGARGRGLLRSACRSRKS